MTSEFTPNLLNGLGYGEGLFYPALFHLPTALITVIFNISALTATKISFVIITFLSAVAMYRLMLYLLKKREKLSESEIAEKTTKSVKIQPDKISQKSHLVVLITSIIILRPHISSVRFLFATP